MKVGMQDAGRPRTWPHCVRWEPSPPPPKGAQPPVLIIVMILSWRQTRRQPARIKSEGNTVGIEQEDPSAMDGRTL